jgi:hypothetical protein
MQSVPHREHNSITKNNPLMLFRELTAVYSNNDTKHTMGVNICGY